MIIFQLLIGIVFIFVLIVSTRWLLYGKKKEKARLAHKKKCSAKIPPYTDMSIEDAIKLYNGTPMPYTYPPSLWWYDECNNRCARCGEAISTGHQCKDVSDFLRKRDRKAEDAKDRAKTEAKETDERTLRPWITH